MDIDDKTLRRMIYYCGGDPRIPREITITVLSEWGGDWTLAEFVKLVNDATATIPQEYKSAARVKMSSGDEAGDSLKITYCRPQNAKEVTESVDEAFQWARREQQSERETYERLKREYDGE